MLCFAFYLPDVFLFKYPPKLLFSPQGSRYAFSKVDTNFVAVGGLQGIVFEKIMCVG